MNRDFEPRTFSLEGQGETLTFFGPPDPSAPRLDFDVRMAPGASGPEPHIHPKQSERFAVVSGRMRAVVDGEEHVLEPGQELLVMAGQVHSFDNGSPDEPLLFRCTAEPALNLQWFLSESAKSAIRSGGHWRDASLLEIGFILHQMPGEYRLAGMPRVVEKVLIWTLAAAAVILGKARNVEPVPVRTELPASGTPATMDPA